MNKNFKKFIKDEQGSLQDLTWVLGGAIVTALIVVGAMIYAPATAQSFWTAATNWIRTSFGF